MTWWQALIAFFFGGAFTLLVQAVTRERERAKTRPRERPSVHTLSGQEEHDAEARELEKGYAAAARGEARESLRTAFAMMGWDAWHKEGRR